MLNELLALKAKAEHDMLYAQAKLEVVGELLEKFEAKPVPVEQTVIVEPDMDFEEEPTEEAELTEV
jgi:hypothetical protein